MPLSGIQDEECQIFVGFNEVGGAVRRESGTVLENPLNLWKSMLLQMARGTC